jgi:hypothetical protein
LHVTFFMTSPYQIFKLSPDTYGFLIRQNCNN